MLSLIFCVLAIVPYLLLQSHFKRNIKTWSWWFTTNNSISSPKLWKRNLWAIKNFRAPINSIKFYFVQEKTSSKNYTYIFQKKNTFHLWHFIFLRTDCMWLFHLINFGLKLFCLITFYLRPFRLLTFDLNLCFSKGLKGTLELIADLQLRSLLFKANIIFILTTCTICLLLGVESSREM